MLRESAQRTWIWAYGYAGHRGGSHASRFLQKHDHPRRSRRLARRIPPSTTVGDVYLKLTVIADVLIVSFKEL